MYISRKNKIEQRSSDDVYVCFLTLVKSRVLIDFQFYRTMKDLSTFEQIWCSHGALCVLSEDVLVFSLSYGVLDYVMCSCGMFCF